MDRSPDRSTDDSTGPKNFRCNSCGFHRQSTFDIQQLMLWMGRCRVAVQCNVQYRFYSQLRRQSDPLRIAFFGTDEFSNLSLKELFEYSQANSAIERLDLITRAPKPSGRGRKFLKETISTKYAKQLGINVIFADSVQEINTLAEHRYNMAVAVSYGNKIPSDFLNSCKYGGLNVHPSLLPRLRGPAPIQQALLKHHEFTGVSVQTLHPEKFDRGEILYQPDPVNISDKDTVQSLAHCLGNLGAKGLVNVIENRLYVPPIEPIKSDFQPSYAPKLATHDKEINLQEHGVKDVLTKYRVFGQVHFFQDGYLTRTKAEMKSRKKQVRRVIFNSIRMADADSNYHQILNDSPVGQYDILDTDKCIIKLKDGILEADSMLLEGFAFQTPLRFLKASGWRGLYNKQFI